MQIQFVEMLVFNIYYLQKWNFTVAGFVPLWKSNKMFILTEQTIILKPL